MKEKATETIQGFRVTIDKIVDDHNAALDQVIDNPKFRGKDPTAQDADERTVWKRIAAAELFVSLHWLATREYPLRALRNDVGFIYNQLTERKPFFQLDDPDRLLRPVYESAIHCIL